MIRVLLIAPYASVRAGLHSLLADAADCTVVGQASGSGDLARLLPDLRPDVVLLDASPGEVGPVVEALRGLDIGLAVLDERLEDGLPLAQGSLTAWAWLRKDAEAAEIAGAVGAVAAGLVVMDAGLVPLLANAASPVRETAPPDEALTTREREVLQLMAQGLPNKQIAARLGISLHTAKFHVAAILAKLGATSRTEAVTLGVRRGWVLL
ncbi:MAG: response regulator transcription factor [Armatimonadetes bacterium]|nr:response regulator transcription factor [Armatimonadota bacterium]